MKPSFALTLSHEKVGLLHRGANGWHPVGEVALAEPDLAAALGYLRGSALGLEPQGLSCKVVIPNSEILYLTVRAPGPTAADRRRQIAEALDGRTPYAVEELVFDWSGSGPEVQVAVVAKETLAEAEAFAVEHRFNPVSFVAMPPPGGFGAEPWFGTPAAAEALIAGGARIERDQDPIRVVARESARPAVSPKPPPAAPEAAPRVGGESARAAIAPEAAATPLPESRAEPPSETAPASAPERSADRPPAAAETLPAAEPASAAAGAAAPGAEVPVPHRPADGTTRLPAEEPRPASGEPARAAAPPGPEAARPGGPAPAAAEGHATPAPPAGSPGPGAAPADADAAAASGPTLAPEADRKPETHGRRRSGERPLGPLDPMPPVPPSPPGRREAEIRVLPPRPTAGGSLGARAEPAAPVPLRPLSDPPPPPRRPAVPLKSVAGDAIDKPVRPPPGKLPPARPVPKARGPQPAPSSPAVLPGPPARPAATAATLRPAVSATGTAPESGPATGRAGTGADTALHRTRPSARRRLPTGLILTGILIVLLAAVAIWASIFLDAPPRQSEADPGPTVPTTATAALPGAPPSAPAREPHERGAPAETAASAGPEPLAPATAAPADDAVVAAPAPAPAPPAEPPQADVPPETVAAAAAPAPAESAAPPAAPPASSTETPSPAGTRELPPGVATASAAVEGRRITAEPADEIFLPAADPRAQLAGRPELGQPDVSRADGPPLAPMPPPPFGTVYRFDAEGRIVATPEGIVTPEGVRLVAGRPALVPPARPPRAVQTVAPSDAAAPSPPPEAADTAEAPAAAAPAAEPRLAAGRPRARPADAESPAAAVPPAGAGPAGAGPAGAEDESAIGDAPPPGGILVTSLRPRERTVAVRAQDAALRAAEAAEAAAAAAASPLAVAISRKPAVRPASLAAIPVAAAAAAAPVRTASAAAPRAAAPPAAEPDDLDDGEPAVSRAAPAIPTRASVARQATVTGVLNLNRINLIGVYGTSSNRHALVRMPGGDFRRVRVGDRLDGGQVSAIGESELRYLKGGRTVTLAMPRG